MANGSRRLQLLEALLQRATRAAGLVGARIYAQVAQFAFFLIAARTIDVADFGLFSIVFAFAMALALLAEGGWREYLICHDDDALVSRAFGLAGTVSAAMLTVGLLAAATAFAVANDTALAVTIAALAFWIPLRSLCTLHSGLLTKADRIGQITWSAFLSETAGLAAGGAALFAGWGIIALGVAKIVQQGTALATLGHTHAIRSDWRRGSSDRAMLTFSGHILAGRCADFIRGNIAVFVIGFGLNAVAVGLYRAAARISGAASEALREPARVILWSGIRNAGHGTDKVDQARMRKAELLGVRFLCLAAPILLILAAVAEPLVALLLGAKWQSAAPVVRLLAFAAMIGLVTILAQPVFSLADQPRLARNQAIIGSTLSCLATVAAVPFGLHAVAWAEIATSAVMAAVTLWLLHRYTAFNTPRFLKRLAPPIAALLATYILIVEASGSGFIDGMPVLAQVAAISMGGAVAYAVLVLATVLGIYALSGKRLI